MVEKISILQLNFHVGDLSGNCRKIEQVVRKSAELGAQLCVTTELAVCGYPSKDLLLYQDFAECCFAELEKTAKRLKGMPPVLVGCPLINRARKGKPLYNGAALLADGKITALFGKCLLPTYDVFDEVRYFEPWSGTSVFRHDGTVFGVTICEDIWNDPDYVVRQFYDFDPMDKVVKEGAEVVLNLSASPLSIGKQRFREEMIGGLARKYGVKILYANQVGGNDDLVFDGQSFCVDCNGTCVARADGFSEDLLLVNLSNRSDNKMASSASCDQELVWQALVLSTRDYVQKCGFNGVVLGLSGGIDSALTAAVAVEALGSENVTGILMPSPYSSKGSIDDSLDLAQRLTIKTEIISIEEPMRVFEKALAPSFVGCQADTTEENIQSRIRGNLLMAISNKFNLLVLTTGNKSELAVGYCTIYGDMSGGFAVLSDLSKMQVYSVSNWLNNYKNKEIIPAAIINKAPSAELRPDQTDQESLPPYDLLDSMLDKIIVQRVPPHGINDESLSPFALKVGGLLRRSEFKRKQAAPGPKICSSAFGSGWRMPIAAKWYGPE